MIGAFKFYVTFWLSGSLYLLIFFAAVAFGPRDGAGPFFGHALAVAALVGIAGWIVAYGRYCYFRDTPVSKVASASQGYVELMGRAERVAGEPILSPITGLPCCWFRYLVQRKDSEGKWKYEDSGTSSAHFLLVDGTGECVVSPEGAEVHTRRKDTWTRDDRRYTEWLLLKGERLYGLGEFRTMTPQAVSAREEREDVAALLAEWKNDQMRLLERFDLDRDGKIDMKEWELARLQARREVRRRNAETQLRLADGISFLLKPDDGRLFLLTNEMPDQVGARFLRLSWAHLAIAFAAGVSALVLLL